MSTQTIIYPKYKLDGQNHMFAMGWA
jgi:hypothetical protein